MADQNSIDQLCRATASLDATDLPGLVAVQEQLEAIRIEAEKSGGTDLSALAGKAGRLVGEVLFREAADVESALNDARRLIAQIQVVAAGPAAAGEPIDQEILAAWVAGAGSACDDLAAMLVALVPGETSSESVDALKRGIHTLKGEFGVLGLTTGQQLCHDVEEIIARRLKAGMPFPSDAVLAVVDWVKAYAHALATNPAAQHPDTGACLALINEKAPAPDEGTVNLQAPAGAAGTDDSQPADLAIDPEMQDNVPQFVGELKEHLASAEQTLLGLEDDPTNRELVDTLFRAFHTVKGVAGFLNLAPVVEIAHTAEAILDGARSGKVVLTPPMLDVTLRSCDLLGQLLAALSGGPVPSRGAVRTLVGELKKTLGAGGVGAPGAPGAVGPFKPVGVPAAVNACIAATAPTPVGAASPPPAAVQGRAPDTTVKVSTARMDALIDLVGELVIAHQMVAQDPAITGLVDQRLQRNLSHAAKIVRDLQTVSMSLRMVTVKGAFQKMARLVRDLGAKAGRRIEFKMEGEDTELDRTVVDQINDPLVHVIRNACDHGIESPEERARAGKAEAGTVTARAFHQGGEIIVEVEDDGRGLNREKILRKAVERGLLAADRDRATITDAEAFNFTFLPGFSTADKVTDVSGRGVGMDVVRRNIEALRGKAEIRSRLGAGTVLAMRLPLTMAIIDGMVVKVGSQRYVIPTLAIERSYRPTPADLTTAHGRAEMAVVRGKVLPIHRLKRLFNVPDGKDAITEGLLIVLDAHGQRCCLLVDEILGQQQVVIKRLGQGAPARKGIAGGAILGDGLVALIIDPAPLIQEATRGTP